VEGVFGGHVGEGDNARGRCAGRSGGAGRGVGGSGCWG
jgi:hypothetical protein